MAGIAVIVNADDLGISEDVNEATFQLMSRGRVTSATIMANAPATRDAARRAALFPRCSFGVHLNLTQFEPLTGAAGARLLVDERGQMSRANETARPHPQRLRAVYREFCAQIDRVASLGVCISHLDSHNHVHTRPFVFPALKAVQRRYGLRRVRLAKNFYSPDQPCSPDLFVKKRIFNLALKSVLASHTTDAFTEFLTYYRVPVDRQRSIERIELMVHPGAAGAVEETTALDSDWVAQTGLPIQLISYRGLPVRRGDPARRAPRRAEVRPCG